MIENNNIINQIFVLVLFVNSVINAQSIQGQSGQKLPNFLFVLVDSKNNI